jgi:hypothetical protein
MTEVVEKAAAAKREVVRTEVTMSDGRVVSFAGKKKMVKEVIIDAEHHHASVRFDFLNGETRSFKIGHDLMLQFAGHGASQKIGDEAAGEEDVDDMVIAIDAVMERLSKGEWSARREGGGDGFSGASVVIRAIAEVTGKDIAAVKAFLDGKLAQAEAKGEKLSRQELYKSFRNPASKTGQVILRMEQEKASKSNKVNADELLDELN